MIILKYITFFWDPKMDRAKAHGEWDVIDEENRLQIFGGERFRVYEPRSMESKDNLQWRKKLEERRTVQIRKITALKQCREQLTKKIERKRFEF